VFRHRVLVLLLLALGSGLAGARPAAALTWSTHKLPQANGGLLGVSCTSASFCMAVGSVQRPARGVTLAQVYNGAGWAVVPTPNIRSAVDNELLSVSCTSPLACMAVGFRQNSSGATGALAERWDGFAWSILPMPRIPRSGLAGVSCPSPTTCMAVGGKGSFPSAAGSALVERWNGTRWSPEHVPRIRDSIGEALRAISCATPTTCTAVGAEFARATGLAYAIAVQWHAHRFKTQLTYGDGYDEYVFNAVSCLSAGHCVAIGERDVPNTASYGIWARHHGFRWSEPRANIVADNPGLDGLSCTGARACVAVGGVQAPQAYAETWNGRRWVFDQILNPRSPSTARLDAVSCVSRTRCVAVGLFQRGNRPSRPLVALSG
jgi:hypothetical protein